ncbi:MAG: response regulator transcription factor [Leptolyngbya sp. IPPAS B-1204]|jgi:chemotaxis family two-component system response regulator PixH|uniref:Response regulator n=1 Tax=Leptolyngbya sp. NK1-12 TaxID=2547451 RepID=A0AA97AG07_9CYAN|nr:response regulator [Leptolyngbya sp. NK1-12]MBF2048338.1 response regulator [Elainella sp. C42_A2020_010]RNJ66015.1 MAG: response regulator [Leptolyngbya sp. IPPAS B-1204]WNZ23775.1 response regulator [Leptolyngbya sp. NK1-12]
MGTALVIDDSMTDREVLTACLRQAGMTVMTATTGEEGLEKLSISQPDIIIVDVVLPGCSGFEVCRELKAQAKTSKIPVIISSTKGTEMDKFWGMKQGADAYIPKPIDQEELIRTVKKLVG